MVDRFSFALVAAVAIPLLACRCNCTPPPVTVGGSDASGLCEAACTAGYTLCSTFPDGGGFVCVTECEARFGRSPTTLPSVLACEGAATTKAAFLACGGSGC
jgi:hypothetical protein